MKKTARFLSIALALLLIVPMLAAFVVSADGPTPKTYDEAADGDLLRTVNFKAAEWHNAFATDSNKGADVEIAEDGSSVKLTVQNANNKRAMWGGFYSGAEDDSPEDIAYDAALGEVLPMKAGVKYTFTFDLTLGSDNVAFGIQVDGQNSLNICGNGQSRWYSWNDNKVSNTSDNNEKWNYHYASGSDKRDQQTFAVVLDYDAKTMTLYILDINDGQFYLCRSIYFSDDKVWDSSYFRCRLSVRSIGGTPDGDYFAEVSNLNVYKGDTMNVVTEAAYTPYDEAQDGDVLYVANFKGDSVWRPTTGVSSAWDSMKAEVAEDGKSVSLTPVRDHDKGRSEWGGALNTDLYTAPGHSYTVEFTVTAEAEDQKIGFYPDWGTGFVVTPGMNQFSVGQWGNWTKVRAAKDYFGSGSLTQTYAVEIAVSNELRTVNEASFYTVTDYNLYVKVGEDWLLVYALSEENECAQIAGVSELAAMQWTEEDNEMVLRFFRSPSQNKSVTVSDMVVYKGLTHSAAGSKELIPGSLNVDSFEDGELIWKVDFTDTENFTTPGALKEGFPVLDATIDETDHGKVTLSVPASEDGESHYWGGQIKGLPLDDEQQYTIFVTVERSAALSATDPVIGISADGKYYVVGDSSYLQITVGGTGKVRSPIKYSEAISNDILGNHEDDYSTTTEPFIQTYAIEIDGPNRDVRAIRVYALAEDGFYELISNTDSSSAIDFMNGNLSLYFFQKDAEQPVTVENVQIYKGRVINALNDALLGDDPTPTTPTNPGKTDKEPSTTAAPQTSEAPAKKSGCKGTVSSAAILLAVVILSSSVVFIGKKKHTDEI